MPASKAQQKAVTKYVKAKYDRFGLTMPKGELDVIKAHAEVRSESVNGFINRAIQETMERDTDAAQAPREAGAGILTPATLRAAGEAVPQTGTQYPAE